WSRGHPSQKAQFVRRLRAMAAAGGRRFVEQRFATERVPARLALVKAMATDLSPADAPFLEGLTKDRARSVAEAAEIHLALVAGSSQRAERIRECLSRIKRTKEGFLRRRTVLRLDYPATVLKQEYQQTTWAIATFGSLSLDDLAGGLGVSTDEVIAGAKDD